MIESDLCHLHCDIFLLLKADLDAQISFRLIESPQTKERSIAKSLLAARRLRSLDRRWQASPVPQLLLPLKATNPNRNSVASTVFYLVYRRKFEPQRTALTQSTRRLSTIQTAQSATSRTCILQSQQLAIPNPLPQASKPQSASSPATLRSWRRVIPRVVVHTSFPFLPLNPRNSPEYTKRKGNETLTKRKTHSPLPTVDRPIARAFETILLQRDKGSPTNAPPHPSASVFSAGARKKRNQSHAEPWSVTALPVGKYDVTFASGGRIGSRVIGGI